jgi:hypothetical protein
LDGQPGYRVTGCTLEKATESICAAGPIDSDAKLRRDACVLDELAHRERAIADDGGQGRH